MRLASAAGSCVAVVVVWVEVFAFSRTRAKQVQCSASARLVLTRAVAALQSWVCRSCFFFPHIHTQTGTAATVRSPVPQTRHTASARALWPGSATCVPKLAACVAAMVSLSPIFASTTTINLQATGEFVVSVGDRRDRHGTLSGVCDVAEPVHS